MIGNRRDLGGIETRDGRRIRPGCLVRSAHLAQAEAADLEGIAAVIDLRTPGERAQEADRTFDCEYLPIPVFDDVQAGISHEQGTDEWVLPDMAILYGRLVRECTGSLRKIVKAIMEHDFSRGAVLWHCTEGKDRCGITTALVLEALGVDREVIREDYLKTNAVNLPKAAVIRERLAATRGQEAADRVYQAYIADERYLQAAWDAMGNDYLAGSLGIGEEEIDRFRAAVLE